MVVCVSGEGVGGGAGDGEGGTARPGFGPSTS